MGREAANERSQAGDCQHRPTLIFGNIGNWLFLRKPIGDYFAHCCQVCRTKGPALRNYFERKAEVREMRRQPVR